MPVIIKSPLEEAVKSALLTRFQEKIKALILEELGAENDPMRKAFTASGGAMWCDANQLVSQCAAEAHDSTAPASKIREHNRLHAGYPPAMVDWVPFNSDTPEALQQLLNRCLNRSLIITFQDQGSPEWKTADQVQVDPHALNQPKIDFSVTNLGLAHYLASFGPAKGEFEYKLVDYGAGSDLYELVLRVAFCQRGASVSHPLFGLWAPWTTLFRKIPPIVKDSPQLGSCLWGWRSDKREPNAIFHEGFTSKLESRGSLKMWPAVCDAYQGIRRDLNTALNAANRPPAEHRVCIRYGDEDLCLNTSIAVATCFAGAVVFPLDEPSPGPDARPVRRARQNIVNEEHKTTYVYAIRKPRGQVHDTGHIQAIINQEQPWAEVATPRVDPGEILFAVEVKRWPRTKHEGQFRVHGVYCRNQDGSPSPLMNIADQNTLDMLRQTWPALWPCLEKYLPQPNDHDNFSYMWTALRGEVRRGVTEVGCCAAVNSPHQTDLVPPPVPPTQLTIQGLNRPWTLHWHSAHPCKVKRKSPGEEYIMIGTSDPQQNGNHQFQDNGVEAGSQYIYQVVAYDHNGESQPTTSILKTAPLLPPASLMANPHNQWVELTWLPSTHATKYRVERMIRGEAQWHDVQNAENVIATSFDDTDVRNGVEYLYRVYARNNIAQGQSQASNAVTATPQWCHRKSKKKGAK